MGQKFLFCDCCDNQVMAIDHGDKVVVKARHHGKDHFLTITNQVESMEFTNNQELVVASSSN